MYPDLTLPLPLPQVRKVAERKFPKSFEFLSWILPRISLRIFPELFEEFSCFVSWETETIKNSPKTPAIFQCKIPRQIRKKMFTKSFWRGGKVTLPVRLLPNFHCGQKLRRADTQTPTRWCVLSTHSDTQAVPAIHCIRICLKAFFRHASVFKTHRHAVYHCLKEVQKPFRHANVFKTLAFRHASVSVFKMRVFAHLIGGVPTTPDPNTSAKVSRCKWEAYRDTNWWRIYYFLPSGGHTFAKVSR